MEEFFTGLDIKSQLLGAYIIIYGFAFGVGNTYEKIKGFLNGVSVRQNELGRIGDAMFWFAILLLGFKFSWGI